MAGAVLLTPGMAGFIEGPQLELGVGPNYEQFDGLSDNDPNTINPAPPIGPEAGVYYDNPVQSRQGPSNRGTSTPLAEQVYTPGPIVFPVGTLGAQPWPARAGQYRGNVTGGGGPGGYTPAVAQGVQFRLGVGQRGPSELGVAQTVALSEITNSPPEPGDLTSILSGQG